MFKFRDKLQKLISHLPHPWRWAITALLGFSTIVIGIVMLPLPGPGTLVIFIGVTVLALEFEWARELSKKGEQGLEKLFKKIKSLINRNKKNEDTTREDS